MIHSATSPTQTPRCLFGVRLDNHNETLIARPARGESINHNETLIGARRARRSGLYLGNHNETLIAVRPARSIVSNHNEILIAVRPACAGAINHNETLIADSRAWPYPELRIPVTVAPVG
jgi:hypothetical protein